VNVISIGEVLWDVVGSEEHLGGATFNFSAHLTRLGHQVSFISGVGDDARGRRILETMRALGISTSYVRHVPEHATGLVTVTLKADGQPEFVLHRPAAYDFPQLTAEQMQHLLAQDAAWIYFGTLHQVSPVAKALTSQLLGSIRRARRFYDVNLRVGSWTPELVRELMAQATVVKLNEDEVGAIAHALGTQHRSLEDFCRAYAGRYEWEGVCVTRGSGGCALLLGNEYLEAAGYRVAVADAVGAGDAFAAAFLHGLASGWAPVRIADFANRVGAVVASRTGAIPQWKVEEAAALQQDSERKESA
jgi:fructokinase